MPVKIFIFANDECNRQSQNVCVVVSCRFKALVSHFL